ncbi:hypothetical protein [Aliivibrio fischeri]|uniref:hypothetical protein n=1 Tax=Aliivibrio fischeri TaxID=668 RepID=UPI00080EB68D|nr:hypothetical protein [Aliivibrio fischeri]OCH06585.1 hypothetical protein A6E11_17455 [Aliivibrio fischeri]
MNCYLCKEKAKIIRLRHGYDGEEVSCNDCGIYHIDGTTGAEINSKPKDSCVVYIERLFRERKQGTSIPHINFLW